MSFVSMYIIRVCTVYMFPWYKNAYVYAVYTIYRRPLWVQAHYSMSCLILSSSRCNGSLVTWTVVYFTASKFKHLIFSVWLCLVQYCEYLHSYDFLWLLLVARIILFKVKVILLPTASRPFCPGVRPSSRPLTSFSLSLKFSLDSYGFVILWHPLWREDFNPPRVTSGRTKREHHIPSFLYCYVHNCCYADLAFTML
jgi:hypothetical protein